MRTKENELCADIFINRWSPRSFAKTPLSPEEKNSLFEAANWAPSCYNEQPWEFYLAEKEETQAHFLNCLTPNNRAWAQNAPIMGFLCVRKKFQHNQKENQWAAFDAGSAWTNFTLQANQLGFFTHPMAGFDPELALKLLQLDSEEHLVVIAFVTGKHGPTQDLPEALQKLETPNSRKPWQDIIKEI